LSRLIVDSSFVICLVEEVKDSFIYDNLQSLGYEFILPHRVINEVTSDSSLFERITTESTVKDCDISIYTALENRFFRLGKGELSVLALGKEYHKNKKSYYCVLDDKIAREACQKIGLNMKGTIGLCNILIENKVMNHSKADQLIKDMKRSGMRLPDNHRCLLTSQ